MPSKIQVAAILGAVAASVNAHGHLSDIKVDGTDYTAYDPSFQYQNPAPEVIEWSCPECLDNGYVDPSMYTDVTKIACHKDATAGAKVAKVAAGGTVDIQWNTWPESHVGPIIDYMAKVDDATSAKAADLSFFKIDEAGYEDGQWAATKLISNNLTWSVTVPSSIAPGQYVLRHEIIALHSAGQENGAQNYPKCINLEVTGSGTENPTGVTADKFYTPTDPGIEVNVYSGDLSGYQIPGPALFSGASSGSSNTSAAAPASSAAAATSAAPVATSSVAVQNNAVSTPVASATATAVASSVASAAPVSTSSSSSDSSLPETFTLETFISWLEKAAGSSSSKARRHARAFRG
ncbi:lytic polysaccharide monooxygenase [Macroventuria anomochaeta]|uniref:Lytic polysaccharide monooxygenase n=1 Tax=Macroventuria anomochaeta TaxID=301207 RepID=A0ACB6SHA5_9PLEO|nr:lytic polysaccharide monooxygenase [Macroventuria anomochaeta]KAF2633332.1 lytic polysaccharide monooxygenase [Macroventuria anomochaeta]